MAAFGVNTQMLYGSMKHTEWHESWGTPHEGYIVNIPLGYLSPHASLFADISHLPTRILVRCLAWIVSHPKYAPPYRPADGEEPFPYYYQPGIPNSVQYIELLKASNGDLMGYRLWVLVLDPRLHVFKGFPGLIEDNQRRKKDEANAKGGGRGGGKGGASASADGNNREDAGASAGAVIRPGDIVINGDRVASLLGSGADTIKAPEAELLSMTDLIRRVWAPFTMSQIDDHDGNIHQMYSSSTPLTAVGQQFHPLEAMSMANGMKRNTMGVRKEQCDASNYCTGSGSHPTFDSFSGKFPDGTEVYQLHTSYFTPNFLQILPLPNLMQELMSQALRNYNASSRTLESTEADLSGLDPRNPEYSTTQNRAEAIRRLMVGDAEEMDEHFMTLVRTSPSMGMGGGVNNLLCGAAVDAIVAHRDAFIGHVKINRRIYKTVESLYPKGTRGDATVHAEFCAAMQERREIQLGEFWRTFMGAPPDRLTQTVIANRAWFKALPPQDQFTTRMRLFEDLSPFGNMVVRMSNDFEDTLRLETNFQTFHLVLLVVLSAYRFSWELHPNLLITGDPGTGKSFLVTEVEKISIQCAILNLTHVTKMAFQTDQDMSDMTYVQEETPGWILGADERGNEQAADPYTKNRLTRCASATISPEIDPVTGARRVVYSFNRCMSTNIFLSNDIVPESGAALSRMIHIHMRKLQRTDTGGRDSTLARDVSSSSDDITTYYAAVKHGFKLHNMYLFVHEKAIEAGTLPDIDVETARVVMNWILDDLKRQGLPEPDRRHIQMCLDLCRTMTMYYGVEMEFFSELARDSLEEREGEEHATFVPSMLEGLVKWSVCTQEIAVYVISLLEFLWVPSLRTDIIRAMRQIAAPSEGRSSGGSWEPSRASTNFRREFITEDGKPSNAAGGSVQQGAGMPPPGPPAASSNGASASAAATSIAATAARAPASGLVPPRAPMPRNVTRINYQYVELLGTGTQEIAVRIAENIKDKPSEADVQSQLKRMAAEFTDSMPHHFLENGNWEPEPGATSDRISLIIQDAIPEHVATGGKRRRLCMAVAILDMQQFRLKDTIERVLCYKGQNPQKMITGFTYHHGDKPFYNVFDCVNITAGTNGRAIANSFGRTRHQDMFAQNYATGVSSASAQDLDVASFMVDVDLDEFAFRGFFDRHGINFDAAWISLPAFTSKALWALRKGKVETRKWVAPVQYDGTYPEGWAAEIHKRMVAAEDHSSTPSYDTSSGTKQHTRDAITARAAFINDAQNLGKRMLVDDAHRRERTRKKQRQGI